MIDSISALRHNARLADLMSRPRLAEAIDSVLRFAAVTPEDIEEMERQIYPEHLQYWQNGNAEFMRNGPNRIVKGEPGKYYMSLANRPDSLYVEDFAANKGYEGAAMKCLMRILAQHPGKKLTGEARAQTSLPIVRNLFNRGYLEMSPYASPLPETHEVRHDEFVPFAGKIAVPKKFLAKDPKPSVRPEDDLLTRTAPEASERTSAITPRQIQKLEKKVYPKKMRLWDDMDPEDAADYPNIVYDGNKNQFYYILSHDNGEVEVIDAAAAKGHESSLMRSLMRQLSAHHGARLSGDARESTSYPVVLNAIQRGYIVPDVPVRRDANGKVVGLGTEPHYPFHKNKDPEREAFYPFSGTINVPQRTQQTRTRTDQSGGTIDPINPADQAV